MKTDKDGQIESVFWADARMRMDYQYFGDCISFDTTYRTNKEARPLAIFVGKNNHKKLCVFGAALLYDETIPTFDWLFSTFLECMNNKQPQTIFSDQCQAIGASIKNILTDSYHALCTFHLLQNGVKNLGRKW
ncbi:Protein FAR1-RELATED SEQUENCE 3, partial [Linum grandiflorum]